MKGRKLLFLFAALLFPIAIFIFLKIFGENEFQVPVFYQDGLIGRPAGCDLIQTTPYALSDSVMAYLGANPSDSLYVVFVDRSAEAVQRVSNGFGGDAIQVIDLSQQADEIRELRECILLMPPRTSVVLLDRQGRIRGYYDGSERDEVDRLIVEIKIIIRNY